MRSRVSSTALLRAYTHSLNSNTRTMGDDSDSLSEPKERRRSSSKRASSKSSKKKKSHKRDRYYSDDDSSVEDDDDSCYRDRKSRKKDHKKDKKKRKDKKKKKSRRAHRDADDSESPVNGDSDRLLERNHDLAQALCSLFDGHPALASDLPIMLIRLTGGASFNLSQMTDVDAANGLARVFECLQPFGVEHQEGSAWVWKNPAGGGSSRSNNSNTGVELVLVRVVRALLDQIGLTSLAVDRFENPPPSPQKEVHERVPDRSRDALESSIERQATEMLKSFREGNLASELAVLCKMILEGEVIALDGLPDERLRVALEYLFASCGLEKSEMEVDSDDEAGEDDAAAMGYGLPESNNESAKAMLTSVLQVCHTKPATTVSRRPVKGPMMHPESYDNDGEAQYANEGNVSSDEDEGPLPVGVADKARASKLSNEQVKAIAARRARELACAKQGIELDPSDGNVREEWMLVPGKFDFFSAIKSGQPIRSRQFDAKSKAEGVGPVEQVDPAIQAEIHAIKYAYEEARGPSLMEEHRDAKRIEASQKQPGGKDSWKWNRDKDLDAGRRVDKDALNMILGGAGSDLKNKFQSSL